jgi:hypothetical protein
MQAAPHASTSASARASPAAAEDPGAARGAALHLRLRRQLSAAIPAANVLGALLVFVFLAYVVPTPAVGNSDELVRLNRRLNLIAFVGAMPVLIWIGTLWSLRVNAPHAPGSSPEEPPARPNEGSRCVSHCAWRLSTRYSGSPGQSDSPR